MKDYFFTTESVTEGHPDKVCDYISDSILDEYLEKDKNTKASIDTMITKNKIIVAGEVSSKGEVDIKSIVKNCLKEIGYDSGEKGIDYEKCKIQIEISEQSEELKNNAKKGNAGDQGMMYGFACNETESLMPFGIHYAHLLSKRLALIRKENILDYLGPDGKVQITTLYENNKPVGIKNILISTQHSDYIELARLKKDIIENVVKQVILEKLILNDIEILVNPAGKFVTGGPLADVGLTGRKIIMDTYGGYARHGGGAFSGKDATKVDRSAAYMLRYIAKNIVAKKIADRCEIQIAYSIGKEKPISLNVNTFGSCKKSDKEIIKYILNSYDLTPNGIIKELKLQEPNFKTTSNYGHFGKDNLPWERIN